MIYLCYEETFDSPQVEAQIISTLYAGGYYNIWTHKRLIPGLPINAQKEKTIKDANLFIFCMTDESLASTTCLTELRLYKGSTIIPIKLRHCISAVPDILSKIQMVDFSNGPLHREVAKLLHGIRESLNKSKVLVDSSNSPLREEAIKSFHTIDESLNKSKVSEELIPSLVSQTITDNVIWIYDSDIYEIAKSVSDNVDVRFVIHSEINEIVIRDHITLILDCRDEYLLTLQIQALIQIAPTLQVSNVICIVQHQMRSYHSLAYLKYRMLHIFQNQTAINKYNVKIIDWNSNQ